MLSNDGTKESLTMTNVTDLTDEVLHRLIIKKKGKNKYTANSYNIYITILVWKIFRGYFIVSGRCGGGGGGDIFTSRPTRRRLQSPRLRRHPRLRLRNGWLCSSSASPP